MTFLWNDLIEAIQRVASQHFFGHQNPRHKRQNHPIASRQTDSEILKAGDCNRYLDYLEPLPDFLSRFTRASTWLARITTIASDTE